MEEKTNEHIKMLTLLERMDKHLTLDEAENYVLSDSDFKDGYAILKKGKKVFYKLYSII